MSMTTERLTTNGPSVTRSVIQELIQSAERKIAELERRMEVQRLVISQLQEELAATGQDAEPAAVRPPVQPERTHRPSGHGLNGRHQPPTPKPEKPSIAKMMVEIMRRRGEPMRGAEITDELAAMGYETDAKRGLISNVFSELKRRKELFEKVDRGVYRLKT